MVWYRTMALVFLLAVQGCGLGGHELDGTWVGEDETGEGITLTFGPGDTFMIAGVDDDPWELPDDTWLEYEAIHELDPSRLSVRLMSADSLVGKAPFAVYTIENSRLILCRVRQYETHFGGIPTGNISYEWPDALSGDCSAFERQ